MALRDFFNRLLIPKELLRETPEVDRLFATFVKEASVVEQWYQTDFTKLATAKPLLDAPAEMRAQFVVAALQTALSIGPGNTQTSRWSIEQALRQMLSALLRAELPFDRSDVIAILTAGSAIQSWIRLPLAAIVRTVERYAEIHPDAREDAPLVEATQRLITRLAKQNTSDTRKLQTRMQLILDPPATQASPTRYIQPGEAWANAALASLSASSVDQQAKWCALFAQAQSATTSSPSKTWLKTAKALVEPIGSEQVATGFNEWFPLVGKPGIDRTIPGIMGEIVDSTLLCDASADLLKGLAWSAAVLPGDAIARSLGDLAEACFKKIPGIGARCPRVGNAALAALSLIPGPEAVAQITRIAAKAKKASIRKIVERSLSTSASSQGVSPEELEEMSVPDFGLDANGGVRKVIGAFTAEISISSTDAELKWRGASGKLQSSIPADVKRDHADELKETKRTLKDLQRILPSQATRIERLLLDRRTWPLKIWRERYANHPLVGHFTKRLIWEIACEHPRTFLLSDDGAIDQTGEKIYLPADSAIRLWHPIDSPADLTQAWRAQLMQRSIVQPFKQAHREVYLLTDAERVTGTYSNRFAAHILRQHQFQSLCDARGWKYRLMGNFDSHNTPTRHLPSENISVEFWVDAVQGHTGEDISPSGIFLHMATDQVRFCRGLGGAALPLTTVPPIVFSELMRDVDLFVGVASVGNDPNWHDGGPNGRFFDYWHSYSFGDLSETAKTRRGVLEALMPRLTKLRGKWSLTDNFLVIQGELRTYKIHLGSGNTLMEPNDQYLCIVPDRSPRMGDDVFLPFEGDATLSIILSKAFLLAADKKITDPTITRQIAR